jgi:HAD superfamily hydrolase (TIGR01549 family)
MAASEMSPIDLKKVRVVSWDIDGTMYDLHSLMSAFKRDLFRRMLSLDWIAAWRDFFRLLRFKLFMDKVRNAKGDYRVTEVPGRSDMEATQDEMYGRILPKIGVCPGVLDLLEWFAAQGLKQVVFSDYTPSTKLTSLGLDGFFSEIYAGETLGHLKPSPIAFTSIIEELGIAPDEFLHIGDREDTDGAAAEQVGYQVAIIGRDFDTATALLEALKTQVQNS